MAVDSAGEEREALLWDHCLRCAPAIEVAGAIVSAGASAPAGLARRPPDPSHRSPTCFEIVWERVRASPAATRAQWALAAESMSVAEALVNRPLSHGRLPLSEMMAWGEAFGSARAAFARAGANCWKKDIRRRSAVDEARRLGVLHSEGWLANAMERHDPFDTDSAKADLKSDDVGSARGATPSHEWAERFESEAAKGGSTFDIECVWLLTRRFSPAEALGIWIKAKGREGVESSELAGWTMRCLGGGVSGRPEPGDIRPLCVGGGGAGFAHLLGRAAIEMGEADGLSRDPRLLNQLIEALVDACDLCAVEFEPAAQVLADKALAWATPSNFGSNPYASEPAGMRLIESLARGRALWEARGIAAAVELGSPSARGRRL